MSEISDPKGNGKEMLVATPLQGKDLGIGVDTVDHIDELCEDAVELDGSLQVQPLNQKLEKCKELMKALPQFLMFYKSFLQSRGKSEKLSGYKDVTDILADVESTFEQLSAAGKVYGSDRESTEFGNNIEASKESHDSLAESEKSQKVVERGNVIVNDLAGDELVKGSDENRDNMMECVEVPNGNYKDVTGRATCGDNLRVDSKGFEVTTEVKRTREQYATSVDNNNCLSAPHQLGEIVVEPANRESIKTSTEFSQSKENTSSKIMQYEETENVSSRENKNVFVETRADVSDVTAGLIIKHKSSPTENEKTIETETERVDSTCIQSFAPEDMPSVGRKHFPEACDDVCSCLATAGTRNFRFSKTDKPRKESQKEIKAGQNDEVIVESKCYVRCGSEKEKKKGLSKSRRKLTGKCSTFM